MATDKKPEPEKPTPSDVRRASETATMYWQRFNEATTAGMNEEDCTMFATHGDVGLLRKLRADGCPKHLLAKILL